MNKERIKQQIANIKKRVQAFIFKADAQQDAQQESATKTESKSSDAVQNPVVKGAEGRQEWNDRYMNMSKTIISWRIVCVLLALLTLFQAWVIYDLARQSKIKPYVVETSQGVPYAVKEVSGISSKNQLLVNYAINQFVINARTVIADNEGEKALLDKVYAYSSSKVMGFLEEHYNKNNPFDMASDYTVSINIVNSLPRSDNTWQVIWEETKRRVTDGSAVEKTRWLGLFTYDFAEPNPKHITDNPFGIYITSASWSQDKQGRKE